MAAIKRFELVLDRYLSIFSVLSGDYVRKPVRKVCYHPVHKLYEQVLARSERVFEQKKAPTFRSGPAAWAFDAGLLSSRRVPPASG
jgi:hypothetical protein